MGFVTFNTEDISTGRPRGKVTLAAEHVILIMDCGGDWCGVACVVHLASCKGESRSVIVKGTHDEVCTVILAAGGLGANKEDTTDG